MGDQERLFAGAVASTHGLSVGDHVVETVAGVAIVLRAFERLEAVADLWPIPHSRRGAVSGDLVERHGRPAEWFGEIAISQAALNVVREAWPGVVWVVGKPTRLSGRRAAYGFVGRRLVGAVAQMVHEEVRP